MNPELSENQRALHKLADYISRRDHSTCELKNKLNRNFSEESSHWAIQEADSQGWLPDPQELAERTAHSLQNKGKGRRYIAQYLKEKGLPDINLDHKIEIINAISLLQIKFNNPSNLSFDDKQTAYSHLYRRGFDTSTIFEVLSASEDEFQNR